MTTKTTGAAETTESATEDATPKKKGPRRPTPKQFAYARALEKLTGNAIPEHAFYSGKAMSGFIAANAPAPAAS